MRNIIFYSSYYEAIKELPDDVQGVVYKAIIDYAMEKKEPSLSGIAKGIFALIRPTLDASIKNYENGKKGGRPSQKTESETQSETEQETQIITQSETQEQTESISKNENKKENKNNKEITKKEKVKKEKTTVFIPPIFEEVKAYVESRGNKIDAKRFFDYFTAGKWIDSEGKPVYNWKQKVITWEGKRTKAPNTQQSAEAPLERAARVIGGC